MVAPIGGPDARFMLESHDKLGNFVAALPYRNLQSTAFMNDQGASLNCDIPYREYSQVTTDNLWAGLHELWFYDLDYSSVLPVFAGPLWVATPSSSTGVIACQAQDPLSYFAKRTNTIGNAGDIVVPTNTPADIMQLVLGTANSEANMYVNASVDSENASTVGAQKWPANQGTFYTDIFKQIAAWADGTDYYVRCNGNNTNWPTTYPHTMHIFGGQKKPTVNPRALEYGGALSNHSTQYNAQTLANREVFIGTNGLVGLATDATSVTKYQMVLEKVTSSDLTTQANLNAAAATALKGDKDTQTIPSITTKAIAPIKDFDFGDQFTVVIDDWYVQYSGLIRVVGWQITVAQGDSFTTVIYPNDLSAVT